MPPRPISIWQPRGDGDELVFARPEPSPLGDHHAARRVIPAAKPQGVRRICFFGESAAAGYLYSPRFTPAQVLAAQLGDSFEVIDFARTNERIDTLIGTIEASLQLAPDLLVIFTGNNAPLLETPELSPYHPSPAGRRPFAAALAQAGLAGPAGLARRELARRMEAALARLAEIAAEVPVILVIPEINLADWETGQPVAWLPGDGTARWWRLYRQGLDRLAEEDHAAAEAAAWEMVRLDGSTNPTPYRLLTHAWSAQRRLDEARNAALAEVDSAHYPLLACLAAPQATSQVRRLLAEGAARYGFTSLDLREMFAEHSEIPGRRLFLDYCHLTAEGMGVAMAAVAAQVLERFSGAAPSWREIAARTPAPGPEAEATACLGAAIHTAHRLLPVVPETKRQLLAHWCRQALASSQGIAETMLDLISMRAAPAPAVATAARRRNAASPYPLQLQHGLSWSAPDADLVETMAVVLEENGDRHAREEITERLLAGRPDAGGIDLTVPAHLAEPIARFLPEAMAPEGAPHRAFYRSPWPESELCWIGDGRRSLQLELTARLPAAPDAPERRGKVRIAVNGRRIGQVKLGGSWRRVTLPVPAESLSPGINRLRLTWPLPPVGDEPLTEARRRLEAGLTADLHPVFGEVFSSGMLPRRDRF